MAVHLKKTILVDVMEFAALVTLGKDVNVFAGMV
jgi:hypothetical protein